MPLVVLPRLKAEKRDPQTLSIPGVAFLTALFQAPLHLLWRFYAAQSLPCGGSVWRFTLEAVQIPDQRFQEQVGKKTQLVVYPHLSLMFTWHIQHEPQTKRSTSHVRGLGEGD